MLDTLHLRSAFDISFVTPMISSIEELSTVIKATSTLSDAEIVKITEIHNVVPIGIKKLLTLIEMSKQNSNRSHYLPNISSNVLWIFLQFNVDFSN
jgi:hypothetical protein